MKLIYNLFIPGLTQLVTGKAFMAAVLFTLYLSGLIVMIGWGDIGLGLSIAGAAVIWSILDHVYDSHQNVYIVATITYTLIILSI